MTDTINSRFRLTRKRLGLSQSKVGDICGVSRRAVMHWEEDAKIPANALAALIPHGLDALYVLTDAMQELSLAREEQFLVEQCRDASVEARSIAATVLHASVMTQGMPGAHIVERLHATHQLTLSDIARQIGVSRQAVHQVVHGTGPSLPIASHIAKILGSTPGEVWPKQYGDASCRDMERQLIAHTTRYAAALDTVRPSLRPVVEGTEAGLSRAAGQVPRRRLLPPQQRPPPGAADDESGRSMSIHSITTTQGDDQMTTTAIKNTTIQTIIDATAPLQRLEELASGDPAYMEGLANLLIDQGRPVEWMTLGELLTLCGDYHKQFHAAPLAVQP